MEPHHIEDIKNLIGKIDKLTVTCNEAIAVSKAAAEVAYKASNDNRLAIEGFKKDIHGVSITLAPIVKLYADGTLVTGLTRKLVVGVLKFTILLGGAAGAWYTIKNLIFNK